MDKNLERFKVIINKFLSEDIKMKEYLLAESKISVECLSNKFPAIHKDLYKDCKNLYDAEVNTLFEGETVLNIHLKINKEKISLRDFYRFILENEMSLYYIDSSKKDEVMRFKINEKMYDEIEYELYERVDCKTINSNEHDFTLSLEALGSEYIMENNKIFDDFEIIEFKDILVDSIDEKFYPSEFDINDIEYYTLPPILSMAMTREEAIEHLKNEYYQYF